MKSKFSLMLLTIAALFFNSTFFSNVQAAEELSAVPLEFQGTWTQISWEVDGGVQLEIDIGPTNAKTRAISGDVVRVYGRSAKYNFTPSYRGHNIGKIFRKTYFFSRGQELFLHFPVAGRSYPTIWKISETGDSDLWSGTDGVWAFSNVLTDGAGNSQSYKIGNFVKKR